MKKIDKNWNVWIEGRSTTKYFVGRDLITNLCGESGGSGCGFGGWDVSYHDITKQRAMNIAKKAKSLRCTKEVRVYQTAPNILEPNLQEILFK